MMTVWTVPDHRGNAVEVGSMVRVLDVPRLYEHAVPEDREAVDALRGAILEVYAVDSSRRAWVAQWSRPDALLQVCHTLGLKSSQMERVAVAPNARQGGASSGAPPASPMRQAPASTAAAHEARYAARVR